MKRQKSQAVTQRNQALLDQIKELKTDHPLWGYRRIWSYLKYRQGMPVNKKRVYRLMKEAGYLVTKNYKLNQDYVGTTRDSTGAVNYTMSPAEIASYFRANQGQADSTTYDWAIENGIAKEQARAVLPEGLTVSRMYMNGTLRSWIHYLQLRSANGTQKEHREIALECAKVIADVFPYSKELVNA
jgi:thymidylate synthase ThyX